ncbi:MAG: N-acetylneuraminate synthase family protein [Nanoarchaeota archaeon]|nr:N-acetylneuraminate synthase family protein [Nanoarchaeota archaeon]
MAKEGYSSITVPDEFSERIDRFNSNQGNLFPSKQKALQRAWVDFENKYSRDGEKTVEIDGKIIGPGHPIYVIAEVGINHNGDIDICKKLIDMAVDSGCDAVKFQKRTVDIIYTKEELAKSRDSPFGNTNGDLKRGLEFGDKEYRQIDNYCKEKNITWFASPWDIPSVDFLEKFDVSCYKIASASLTDKGLLERIKATNKPIILSTGMSDAEQVRKAVDILGEDNLVLLSCVSAYPTLNLADQNLKVIETLKKSYSCPVGYSGHEPDTFPTLMAMALGANVIERHITLGRTMYGSDQASSLEKKGLEVICNRAKEIPRILGDGKKTVTDSEVPISAKLRRVDTI